MDDEQKYSHPGDTQAYARGDEMRKTEHLEQSMSTCAHGINRKK